MTGFGERTSAKGAEGARARQEFGPTLLGRLLAEVNKNRLQIMVNPRQGYCYALVQLGPSWDHDKRPVWCSARARDGMFCGRHDHFWAAIGAESAAEYVARHGGCLTVDEEGVPVGYAAPSTFRKTPRVVPFKDNDTESPAPRSGADRKGNRV